MIAVFDGKIKGTVLFTETSDDEVLITIHLTGLKKNHKHVLINIHFTYIPSEYVLLISYLLDIDVI